MTFNNAAKNFIALMAVASLILFVDLVKWQMGEMTWSEAIWEVNQYSLGCSLGVGIVLGHCFTVPRGSK